MKIKKILYSAAIAAVVTSGITSCENSEGGEVRKLSDYKDATIGDSVSYYIGQMGALEYWRGAHQDTMMMDRASRDQFLKGLRAGYDALNDNEAYNQGYAAGLSLAMQMKQMGEDFDVKVNKRILVNAFEDGLRYDSVLDAGEVQKGFTDVSNTLQTRKETADREAALKILKELASSKKLTEVNSTLYASAAQGAAGQLLKQGDRVSISVEMKNNKGETIDQRDDPNLEIGKMYAGPITQALLTMSVGQTRTFYTYAQGLFGRFTQRYRLKGTEVVSFVITTAPAQAQPEVTND